jgi:hypothetical protein
MDEELKAQGSNGINESIIPDAIERELAHALQCAGWIFAKEKDGRFQGSILACQAVARFIRLRGGGGELAAPFLHIAEAFKYLEKGGTPTLFSKKSIARKERERSPERKHQQKLAAMALEVLVALGDEVAVAADKVARKVDTWPCMTAQKVTGNTVLAWRRMLRSSNNFKELTQSVLTMVDVRGEIEKLLANGPPGQFL